VIKWTVFSFPLLLTIFVSEILMREIHQSVVALQEVRRSTRIWWR